MTQRLTRGTVALLLAAAFLSALTLGSVELLARNASRANGEPARPFPWPDGKRMALSVSCDDGRVAKSIQGGAAPQTWNQGDVFLHR